MNNKRMVRISEGPHKDVVGYLSFDEKAKGILNCRIDGVWKEFPEDSMKFESVVHDSKSRGDK